ncbi:MAG: hypothetical protein D3909_13095, partial [Candidatus Electrothrix sp. ATG1]|nr:hypothetical protein [Candidatus Electrothrix sp. ATG1]
MVAFFMDQKYTKNLDLLTISKYLFRFQVETALRLPPYKGSAFHGAFGHALKRISPFYYQQLFEAGSDGAAPRPYVLLPPLESKERYSVGHYFSCELTLFGRAEQFFPICHAALEFLGKEMGLGQSRGRFSVQGVDRACPTASHYSPADSEQLTC